MATPTKKRSLTVVKAPSTRQRRETAEALNETTDEFLECRDLHHPWKVVGFFYEGAEVHRKLLCDRCETEATDRWTARGERIRRAYKYPEGYKVKGVTIRPIDVRREVLKRVPKVYGNEDQLLRSLFNRGNRKQA